MISTLFIYYSSQISPQLKQAFDRDFVKADKSILYVILSFCLVVALITPWQNGYFLLGITGGLIIGACCALAFYLHAGTATCRCIMGLAMTALLAITVQQSNGLGEGHFLFFLGFTILIRYRDILTILVYVGSTVVHHISLTYCQSIGLTAADVPIKVFSWGEQTSIGLLAPLLYHVVFTLMALTVSIYFIYEGIRQFIESNSVIEVIERASEGDLRQQINLVVKTPLIDKVNAFFARINQMITKIDCVTQTVNEQVEHTNNTANQRRTRTNKQQQEVELVATALTQMAAATNQIANNAEQTADALNTTEQMGATGGEIASHCQASIQNLAE